MDERKELVKGSEITEEEPVYLSSLCGNCPPAAFPIIYHRAYRNVGLRKWVREDLGGLIWMRRRLHLRKHRDAPQGPFSYSSEYSQSRLVHSPEFS